MGTQLLYVLIENLNLYMYLTSTIKIKSQIKNGKLNFQ